MGQPPMKPARVANSVGIAGLLVLLGTASARPAATGPMADVHGQPPAPGGRPADDQGIAPGVPAVGRLPETIPIFPLPDAVLFPNASLPLHIFEPRYRQMVADALEGDRIIGMV